MSRPVVAIIGRPNVGKSTLFNVICGRRISIVEDTPGVTRDRIYSEAEWRGRKFMLVDTGGIEPKTSDTIMKQMKLQAEVAVQLADVVIFIVDASQGMTTSDEEVREILRKAGKSVIIAINKVDNPLHPPDGAYDFYSLDTEAFVQISAANMLGIGDLLDEVFDRFPESDADEEETDAIRVAVVGKPNSGKSSLVNKILGEDRMIVSDIPGTTRDAVDTRVIRDDQEFVFVDTAGLRKKNKISEDIERYSVIRSWHAMERADVCLILIDALDGVTEQDTKIAGYAHEQGRASVIAINKWDLVEKSTGTLESYRRSVMEDLSFMAYAPVAFISAKTGQRVGRLYELIKYVSNQAAMRISTGMLNDVLNEAMALVQPPSDKGKRLKIYYTSQVSVKPPSFVYFVNKIDLVHFSYRRYLENHLRKTFGFEGTPIRLMFRERDNKDGG